VTGPFARQYPDGYPPPEVRDAMTDNFQTRGQYDEALQSVFDYKQDRDTEGLGPVLIALSNLAVAEAIHRVAACLEKGTPVMIESRGMVELDPTSVAEAINKILNKERNA